MGALVPLGKVDGQRIQWLCRVAGYTAGGLLSSVIVGILLGSFGLVLGLGNLSSSALAVFIASASVAAILRELGLLRFPLIQPRRQTNGSWARTHPKWAPVAWGADLGLLVTTRFTYSGVWVVLLLAFAAGQPVLAALLVTSYWLGRAAPVWVGPLLTTDPARTPELLGRIMASHRAFSVVHVAGLVLVIASLGVAVLH